jgi:AAT family amino acid transporter
MATALSQPAQPADAVRRGEGAALLVGLVNLAAAFGITWALWLVLLHPNGVLKLYTPMYGFSLVTVLVAVLVAMARVGEGWPFRTSRLAAPVRGALATALAVAITAVVVHGFFWGFLGRYGVTYFSPKAIIAVGGVGAELFNARENASTAIVYFAAAFLWLALVLSLGFGSWPWSASPPGVRAFSRLSVATLLAVVAYAVLFHPHVTQLFYPAQTLAGVPPWWADVAQTGSAYFHLGWVMAAVAVLVVAEVIWGGLPWRLLGADGGLLRGLVAFAGSLLAGGALFGAGLRVMNAFWGEPFQGGQYTDAPYFRYLHVAEVAGFLVLSAFALDTFLGTARGAAGRAARTAVALGGAAALHVFYYSGAATRLLGKVPGMAQPEDTPLVWTLLFLAVVLVQRDLFGGWPLRPPEAADP